MRSPLENPRMEIQWNITVIIKEILKYILSMVTKSSVSLLTKLI